MKKGSFIFLLIFFLSYSIIINSQDSNVDSLIQAEESIEEYLPKTAIENKLGTFLYILYLETTGAKKPVYWKAILRDKEQNFHINEEDEMQLYVHFVPGGSRDIVSDLIKSLGGEVNNGNSPYLLTCYIHPSRMLELAESFHVSCLEPVTPPIYGPVRVR